MSGFFGVVSKSDCVIDLFFGTDYHSHLGTKRGGMAVFNGYGFNRSIHNIENSPFRTKFERDVEDFGGCSGIGCISDTEPQPLLVNSHLGSYAITTVGRINNIEDLREECFSGGKIQFMEMSNGVINPTELVAAIINLKDDVVSGLAYAQERIKGSMSILLLTGDKLYAARDKYGRTPIMIGKKCGARCASFESSAYLNLGYRDEFSLGPAEIVSITATSFDQTRRRFGGRQPLCAMGVQSLIIVTSRPAVCRARIAASRPEPGPLTKTSTVFRPCSIAALAAVSAASDAAKGVDFLLPRKPSPPADAQEMALP